MNEEQRREKQRAVSRARYYKLKAERERALQDLHGLPDGETELWARVPIS